MQGDFCDLREITGKTQEAINQRCFAKNLFWKLGLAIIKIDTPVLVFFFNYYETFQSRLFTGHLWTRANLREKDYTFMVTINLLQDHSPNMKTLLKTSIKVSKHLNLLVKCTFLNVWWFQIPPYLNFFKLFACIRYCTSYTVAIVELKWKIRIIVDAIITVAMSTIAVAMSVIWTLWINYTVVESIYKPTFHIPVVKVTWDTLLSRCFQTIIYVSS